MRHDTGDPHHGVRDAPPGSMECTVRVKVFEGPLDLLLHLIQTNEIDIHDIPMALITQQYLEYLRWMQALNLEVASDYLVMAATLVHIKSKMLLPKPVDVDEDEEEGEDPRAELVERLLEYQRYKEAAQELARREILGRDVFARPPDASGDEDEREVLRDVSIFHLLDAFQRILSERRWRDEEALKVEMDRVSLADRIHEIAELVSRHPQGLPFDLLFPSGSSRRELILTFLALLEMIRLRMVRAHQAIPYGAIRIEGIPGKHKSFLHPDS